MGVNPESINPANAASSWKTRAYIIGAIGGLIVGVLSAHLYVRATQENMMSDTPEKVRTRDMMTLTLSIITLVRQIAELGSKG